MDFEALLDQSTLTIAGSATTKHAEPGDSLVPYAVSKRYVVHARHPSGLTEVFEIKELDNLPDQQDDYVITESDGGDNVDDVGQYMQTVGTEDGLVTYTCLLCHENFELLEVCEHHIRYQHSAPERCKYCYYSVPDKLKSTLLKHVQRKHPQKLNGGKTTSTSSKIQCDRCGALCRSKNALDDHIKKSLRCKVHYRLEKRKLK